MYYLYVTGKGNIISEMIRLAFVHLRKTFKQTSILLHKRGF